MPSPATCSTSPATTSATSPTPSTGSSCSWLQGLAEGCASPDVPPGSVLERGADLLHGELDRRLRASPTPCCTPPTAACSRPQRPPGHLGGRRRGGPAGRRAGQRQPRRRRRAALDLADARPAAQPRRPLRPGRARPGRGHPRLPARPRARPRRRRRARPADRSTYVIQTSYHTALVGAILAAALLRDRGGAGHPGRRPASARRAAPTPDADPLPLLRARRRPVGRGPARPAAAPSGWAAPSWCSAPSCAPPPRGATPRGCTTSWPGRPSTAGRTCRRCARAPRCCARGPGRGPAGHPRLLRGVASAELEVAVVDRRTG